MKGRLLFLIHLIVPALCFCLLMSSDALMVEQGAPHYSGSNDDFGLGDFGAPDFYFC
jgi:hypothetical protein